jgi:hypothetical protein
MRCPSRVEAPSLRRASSTASVSASAASQMGIRAVSGRGLSRAAPHHEVSRIWLRATAKHGGGWEDRGYPRETLNLFLNQAAGRTPQRATAHAIAAAVLRPRTRPESGPSRGTPCIEANRHDATPAPFDRHMPNIARVYPRVLPPESNSPPPQFPSVRRPSGSDYVHRGAWAIPRSRALGAIPALEARGDPRG